MDFYVDLRFLFPPLLNAVIFLLLLKAQGGDVQECVTTQIIVLYPILNLPLPYFILAVMLLLLFLSTPIRIALHASPPVLVRSGELSILLALSVVVSVIFAPSLFWVAYCFLITLSPCYSMLWNLFKRILNWFRQSLSSIPPIFITCVDQNNQEPEPAEVAANLQVGQDSVDLESNHGG